MMLGSRSRGPLAFAFSLVLAFCLGSLPALPADSSAGTASVEGRLVDADGETPVAGVVLQALPSGTDTIYRSDATDKAGRFALRSLPAGTYGLAIETSEGVYLSENALTLTPGKSERILLGLAPAAAKDDDKDDDDDGDEEDGEIVEEDDINREGLTLVKNPFTMTMMTIGGLAILSYGIDETRDDDVSVEERIISPSAP